MDTQRSRRSGRWLLGIACAAVIGCMIYVLVSDGREASGSPDGAPQDHETKSGQSPPARGASELEQAVPTSLDPGLPPRSTDIKVQVVGEDGSPIVGSRVCRTASGQAPWEIVGITDASGTVPAPRECGVVAAAAEGFQARSSEVKAGSDGLLPAEVTLILPRASVYQGYVTWGGAERATPRDGVEVLAVPVRSPVTVDLALGADRSPFCVATTLESDGTFVLPGFDPHDTYRLVARGPGIVALSKPLVTALDRPVEVQIGRLCATLITLFDPLNGGPVQAVAGAFGPRGMQCVSLNRSGSLGPLTLDALDAAYAGLEPDLVQWSERDRHLVAYAGARDTTRIGPFKFSADLPGYRLATIEFDLRCSEPRIGETALQLESRKLGWGTLVVRLENAPPGPPTNTGPFGILHLHPLKAQFETEERIEVPIPWRADGSVVELSGVPAGDYQASILVGPFKQQLSIEGIVSIAPNGRATTTVDLSAFGSVALAFRDHQAREYEGPLKVEFADASRDKGTLGRFVNFDKAPYVVAGMPQVKLRVVARYVFPGASGWNMESTCSVTAGQVTPLQLVASN